LKHIILGTAGHIDHGKTSLIRAATGIDTDRLKEEKARGITIELGFAWLDLPGGERVGIVDVPGHEKFVKNMVAGAAGIDVVALIIAADEGVMPQTKEHIDICKLLGVKHGLVVLTKIDMVDEEWLELVTDDIQSFLRGSFLDDAPIIAVSSTTGQGLDDFVNAVEELCQKVPERSSSGLFRLPVDRVFSMKGFGTVITGSLVSGKIRVGESIKIYPSGIESKVRGIQVHNEPVDEASAGVRTAVNFQGLDRSAVRRGDVLARDNTLNPSYMLDVVLDYIGFGKKPLKNRTRVRFYTGTSEIEGVVILLDRDDLRVGERTAAQLRLEAPVSVVKDDRFVIRSYSPIRTIGGGYIIDPVARKHKRFREPVIAHLNRLAEGGSKDILSYRVEASGLEGVAFSDLAIMTNIPEKELEQDLQNLLSQKAVLQVDRENRIYIHCAVFDELQRDAVRILEDYHREHPLKTGMIKEVFKARLPRGVDFRTFNLLVQALVKSNAVVQEKEMVRLSGHKIALQADQEDMRNKIKKTYLEAGLQPPYFKDLIASTGNDSDHMRDVLDHMLQERVLVKVKEDLYFHVDVIDELKNRLVSFLRDNGEIATPQLKEMTGVSRKYMIPLIEYFDDTKVTIRVGDVRRLREGHDTGQE
jgi:selenocysteine-specific elongation factor